MAERRLAIVGALAISLGCGDRSAPTPAPVPAPPRDAAIRDAPAPEIAEMPLGLPDRAAFRWRRRAGQAAFQRARQAEAASDWAQVVARCEEALASDPGHLDASWLLAVGHAKLGQLDRVVAPLARAAAGDFAKWGPASLALPGLQAFLATPIGAAWRRRVTADAARLVAQLARSVVVTGGGDLYAVDLEGARWIRLSRSGGRVLGALSIPSAHQLAYFAHVFRAGKRQLALGVVDLARGAVSNPIPLGAPAASALAYRVGSSPGFWVGSAGSWRQIDADYQFHPLPARTPRPPGPWLEVTARGAARLHALPAHITADWDEQSLASAIRIGTSNRVVTVPSPGLIDGNSAAWSPDRVHLAFVAQLDEHCAPGAVNTAAFVADASTGALRELERAARGIAIEWRSARTLVIAGDRGVTLRSLDDGVAPITIEGATGLATPRERPRCAPPEPSAGPPDVGDGGDGGDGADGGDGPDGGDEPDAPPKRD